MVSCICAPYTNLIIHSMMLYYLLREQAASEEVDLMMKLRGSVLKRSSSQSALMPKTILCQVDYLILHWDPSMILIREFPIQLLKPCSQSCIFIAVLSPRDQFTRKWNSVLSCVLIPISIFFWKGNHMALPVYLRNWVTPYLACKIMICLDVVKTNTARCELHFRWWREQPQIG